MSDQGRDQLYTLLIHAGVVLFTIIAATILAFANHLDQSATAILSTALGFSGGRAASITTRRRASDNNTP